VRLKAGPISLGIITNFGANAEFVDIPVDSIPGTVKANVFDLGAKVLFDLGSNSLGQAGVVQRQLWAGLGANATSFDTSDLNTLTDWTGEVMIGGEWRPVNALGLTAGAGIEFAINDQAPDTFNTAASAAFHFYF